MYALVTIKKRENNIEINLYESREEVENEMILRYNSEIKKANKLDWKHTYLDRNKKYAVVDDWVDQVELRYCEVA